jgi:RNA polymerase sigma-70 factor, ECF subfamily
MLTPLTFVGDNAALIQELQSDHPGAAAAFYDQHASHVRMVLRSVLGADEDIPDLLQEVFIRALNSIGKLREIDRIESWLTTIAIFVARGHVRQRTRRSWLRLFSPEHTRNWQLEQPSSEARSALRAVYGLLDRMPVDDRVVFVLRYIHGMTLSDAAETCRTSLATLKRRLNRAEKRFVAAARQQPSLAEWLEDGTRWTTQKQT